MREIKFRAWSERDGGVMLQIGDAYGTRTPLDCCQYVNQGQPVMLEQYTGLRDKNGVEIYEGDIVEVRADYGGDNYYPKCVGCVKFEDAAFYVDSKSNICDEMVGCSIIGNIHQNPELLNEKS